MLLGFYFIIVLLSILFVFYYFTKVTIPPTVDNSESAIKVKTCLLSLS